MMTKFSRILLLCSLLFALLGQNVQALSLVRAVDLGNLALGERVELEGRFLSRINYETLLFEDESGRVEVVISDGDSLPAQLLSPAYQVVVRGEVGSGYLQAPVLLFDAVKVIAHAPDRVAADVLLQVQNMHSFVHDAAEGEDAEINVCDQVLDTDESVSALLAGHCIGRRVSLVGSFVSQINYETLLFRDHTGEIEVVFADGDMKRLDKDAWSIPVNLQGEVVRGYHGTVMVAFERLMNPSADR